MAQSTLASPAHWLAGDESSQPLCGIETTGPLVEVISPCWQQRRLQAGKRNTAQVPLGLNCLCEMDHPVVNRGS